MKAATYGTILKREGSYGLQEIVVDYQADVAAITWNDNVKDFGIKVVRTPNCHKMVSPSSPGKPAVFAGEDYKHAVIVYCVTNNRYLFPKFRRSFPDCQEGLNAALVLANEIFQSAARERWNNPKNWRIFTHRF